MDDSAPSHAQPHECEQPPPHPFHFPFPFPLPFHSISLSCPSLPLSPPFLLLFSSFSLPTPFFTASIMMPGSIASTMRSRKRRRSDAGPVNSPSIAGVSHRMRTRSSISSALLAVVPLIRTRRDSPAVSIAPCAACVPVPTAKRSSSWSSWAKTANAPADPLRARSAS